MEIKKSPLLKVAVIELVYLSDEVKNSSLLQQFSLLENLHNAQTISKRIIFCINKVTQSVHTKSVKNV